MVEKVILERQWLDPEVFAIGCCIQYGVLEQGMDGRGQVCKGGLYFVTHQSERSYGAGLFCVCIDFVRLFKTCICSNSKLESWIRSVCSIQRKLRFAISVSETVLRERILMSSVIWVCWL